MASLISPGVSVTITDESYFIPAAAVTTPLIFIATADEKKQAPAGSSSPTAQLDATGTFESGVVRTVTSLKQSVALYGIPTFLRDSAGNALHGDARNEYGLFALNQFLGIGNRAYVVRANVNLNDNIADIRSMWGVKMQEASYVLENIINTAINEYNLANGYTPASPFYKTTVSLNDLITYTETATAAVWATYTFGDHGRSGVQTPHVQFIGATTTQYGYDVYPTGFGNPPSATPFDGFAYIAAGIAAAGTNSSGGTYQAYDTNGNVVTLTKSQEWTPEEAGSLLVGAADQYQFTMEFANATTLGANDAQRRVEIVKAFQEAINSNTDIRSETYEYNLILCPGYHEVADELVALATDIGEEAFVIADTPMTMDADQVAVWAATSNRQTNRNIAYYYPHGYASNLDGSNVVCAASGVALRTYTYSDEVSELWFAPAGTRRGVVTGPSTVGYVSGTLGSPTVFNEVALNQGQRDNLYKYFTNINPIVFFPGRGLIVWGQKTSAPDASAMDRVNVVRLMGYIKRQLRKNTMSFVFEPNDQLTRDNLKAVVDSFLGDLIVKRGLYDFATICDESNNTPDRIDRNELYIDVALKPVKAAEFIYIPIRVVNTGASI